MNNNICETYSATTLQQLTKIVTDEESGKLKEKDVFPISIIQAIFDGITGKRLDNIIASCNCIYVPFQGTFEDTRLLVDSNLRRKGFILVFNDLNNNTHTQQYINSESIEDEDWKQNINWKDFLINNNDNSNLIEELKQYIVEYIDEHINNYIDEKLKSVIPPDGYELVIVNKNV